MSAEAVDPVALAALAEQLARAAGEMIAQGRPDRVEVAATKSSPTDVVTAMDRAAEALITDLLARARPDDAVFGEEGVRVAGASGLTWVIDPIDGTVNYLYGLPAYAVSVAVVTGDPGGARRLARRWPAACYNPASTETWTAAAGSGAFLNGVRLGVLPAPDLSQALIGTGFGYRAQDRAAQAEVLGALLPLVRDIRRIGSAALDLCAVATGRLDGYYERGLHVWDIAAGLLVVLEAGGAVTGPAGGAPSEELVVCAREPLLSVLLERVDIPAAERRCDGKHCVLIALIAPSLGALRTETQGHLSLVRPLCGCGRTARRTSPWCRFAPVARIVHNRPAPQGTKADGGALPVRCLIRVLGPARDHPMDPPIRTPTFHPGA